MLNCYIEILIMIYPQILYILSPYCTLNYLPPNAQDFFAACVSRCEPFLDSLPAGYLVDLTHILTFLQQFPEVFIRRIFSLDFLTKLDEELESKLLFTLFLFFFTFVWRWGVTFLKALGTRLSKTSIHH